MLERAQTGRFSATNHKTRDKIEQTARLCLEPQYCTFLIKYLVCRDFIFVAGSIGFLVANCPL
jgi:hypothetical protein